MSPQKRPCAPGQCQGKPHCRDTHCPGHPHLDLHHDVQPHERDPRAMRWFLLTYIGGILAALVLVARSDAPVAWLLH